MVVFGFGLRRTAAVWNGMKPTDGRQQNQESNAPTTQCSSLAFRYHNLTETTLLLRIRGEIMMTDGFNINLSYCWVTEDTLVLLCWEILKISLRQNFNTITVRKTLPVGGYSGQPITELQILFTAQFKADRVYYTYTHYFLYTSIYTTVRYHQSAVWYNVILTICYGFSWRHHHSNGMLRNVKDTKIDSEENTHTRPLRPHQAGNIKINK